MDLDNVEHITELDRDKMFDCIFGLPEQLQSAWKLGLNFPLPDLQKIQQVVVTGMGGSAIGADLVAAYTAEVGRVPVFIHRDYGLPAWANGEYVLVIASSHSGNTEETLSSYQTAIDRGCQTLVISTGGELASRAKKENRPVWVFDHQGQPRTAVGFSFGLLLAVLTRMGGVPDATKELEEALEVMKSERVRLTPDVPTAKNAAKRMAGQCVGRWVAVFGAGVLAPVARRWKGQISELAKAWGQFESLPEADHNTLAGLFHPEDALVHTQAIFLTGSCDHPRNAIRAEITRRMFMQQGLCTDIVEAKGRSQLAQMWNLIQFGDYAACYLAMAYGIDPTPVELLTYLKQTLKNT